MSETPTVREELVTGDELVRYLAGAGKLDDKTKLCLATGLAAVRGHVERTLSLVTNDVAEFFHGDRLVLTDTPIRTVHEVLVDGAPVAFTTRRLNIAGHVLVTPERAGAVVSVRYDHGYPHGHPRLEAARSIVLRCAAREHRNPLGRSGATMQQAGSTVSYAADPRLLHTDEKAQLTTAYVTPLAGTAALG